MCNFFDLTEPLPHNRELELDALAGFVWADDPELQRRVAATNDALFYDPAYAALWRVCRRLALDAVVDPTSLMAAVMADQEAGMDTVTQVLAKHVAGGPRSLQHWFGELAKLAHRRAIVAATAAASAAAYAGTPDPAEIETGLEVARQQHLATYHPDVAITIEEAAAQWDAHRQWLSGEHGGLLASGLHRLDDHYGIPPEYCVVLARSSVGKTALGLSWAVAQVMAGRRILFWSGEQGAKIIIGKLLSIITGLSAGQVNGVEDITAEQQQGLMFARQNLAKLPLHLLDGQQDVASIWGKAMQIAGRYGRLDGVYLDQLDKLHLHGSSRDNRETLFARASQDVFRMTNSLGCPVILLAQLGIKHQERHPVPAGWQIRDCSQVIQDADRVYILDRPQVEPERWRLIQEKYLKARGAADQEQEHRLDLAGKGIVRLEKNRNGLGGLWEERVGFDQTCGKWCNGRGRVATPNERI